MDASALHPPSPAAPWTVRIDLAYDGSAFAGWQVQPDQRTVQGELTRCLRRLAPCPGFPPGAGRTDAGVHARGQVASLPLEDPGLVGRIERALPRMVPEDMAVTAVQLRPGGFHARFSATGRRYSYRLLTRRDPLRRRDHWFLPGPVDIEAMVAASRDLPGEHDCTSFCKGSSLEEGRTLCRIRRAEVVAEGEALVFHIEADRFLHSMVRTIVGTLVEIGRGRRPVDAFPSILEARRREAAGFLAPAHGLCLEEVHYGEQGRSHGPPPGR